MNRASHRKLFHFASRDFDLKDQLGIAGVVSAAIVPNNPLLVCVPPVGGAPATFQMAFEARSLAELNADDLKAIVAPNSVMSGLHAPSVCTNRACCQHGDDGTR